MVRHALAARGFLYSHLPAPPPAPAHRDRQNFPANPPRPCCQSQYALFGFNQHNGDTHIGKQFRSRGKIKMLAITVGGNVLLFFPPVLDLWMVTADTQIPAPPPV